MDLENPCTSDTTAITEAVPIRMPSVVRKLRMR